MLYVKKYLPVLLELAIVVLAFWAALNMPAGKPPIVKEPEIIPDTDFAEYINADFGFSVRYPKIAEIKTDYSEGYLPATHNLIVGIMLPRDMFAGTNLGEAGIFIGANSDPEVVKKCADISVYEEATTSMPVMINGEKFMEFDSVGVGAGNYYDFKIFRTIKRGSCYEIAGLLHSSNIGNYAPGTVKEFDREKIAGILKNMTESFLFTPESGSGVMGRVELGPTCPVERIPPDPRCAPKPYETEISISKAGSGKILKNIKTDADGRFTADLSPGKYDLRPGEGKFLPRCGSSEIEVLPENYAYAVFSCDSGIR